MLNLDHIIWTGSNIERSSEKYGADFAVKSVKGGEHEEWGTFNYLTYLSNNCYMEWLGIRNMELAEQVEHPLIKHLIFNLQHKFNGAFQFALRTDKLDSYIIHFKENNIPFIGPIAGKRRKPSGKLLSWRMLFPTYDIFNGETIPFLIEWDQPEHERVDVSLINHQAITSVYYGGMTKERFTKVFNLPFKKIQGNKVNLRNAKIHFTEDPTLRFDLN